MRDKTGYVVQGDTYVGYENRSHYAGRNIDFNILRGRFASPDDAWRRSRGAESDR